MKIEGTLDKIHEFAIQNVWLQRFTIFTRVMIAVGFIPSGMKKVLGLPFTQLGVETPVGYFSTRFIKPAVGMNLSVGRRLWRRFCF